VFFVDTYAFEAVPGVDCGFCAELEWSAEIVDDVIFELACGVSHPRFILFQEVFRAFSIGQHILGFLEVFRGKREDIRRFFGGRGGLWA
jgi:hypothetical protein